jgi:TonB-linked SusC/RagA family outer membrane protein
MRLRRWVLPITGGAACVLLALSARSLGAQGTVTGRVTAKETSAPLGGVNVLVIGANISAVTGDDGNFILHNVGAGAVELQALRVGYRSLKQRVTVTDGQTTTANFELTAAVIQLQEIVTTATGPQRRVELGNAVSMLGDVGKRVEESQIANFSDLLVAKAPGVVVLPASTLGGAPSVRIRGASSISLSNAPIYYVDGVRYSSSTTESGTDTEFSLLNSLNPEEIASMEIVKGPSAATLYGTDAANGVILITTKRGSAGATRWDAHAEYGIVDDRTSYQDMYANWGHAPSSTTPIRCQLATMGPSTCLSDSVTHYNLLEDAENTFVHNGNRQSYGLNVSGGSDAVRFFVSGNLDSETGPIQMPGFEVERFAASQVDVRDEWFHPLAQRRLNLRTNLSASVTPKLDLSISSGFAKDYNRIMPESDLIISLYYIGMQNYGFKGPGLDKDVADPIGTPLHDYLQWAPGDVMQAISEQNLQRMTSSANMAWRPFSWMKNDATIGMDAASIDYFTLCRVNECPPFGDMRAGEVTNNKSNVRNYSARVISTSTWNARPWASLATTVGADYTVEEHDELETDGSILPPGGSSVDQAATRNVDSQLQPTAVKTLGLYVQEQVALHDRLFLTGAVRTDQNSAFGSDFQRVFYPKASVSWLTSDEGFFPEVTWLDQFRIRAAYGASGVQPGATAALATYNASSVSIAQHGVTEAENLPSLIADSPGNPKLKPETSTEYEGGFDAQLFDNKVRLEYTYYHKKTRDALISVPIAPSSAAPDLTLLQNIGSTKNSGHEVQVSARLVDLPSFGWDVTVNASHNTNEVVDLGIEPASGEARTIGKGSATQQVPGYPMNGQWYRDYTYNDDNGDGILQVAEVHVDSAFTFAGTNAPRNLLSIISGFDLFGHKLRLNAMFDYKGGGNTQDGANNFQCNSSPRACRETQDPTTPLWMQARAIAKTYGTTINGTSYKTARGYYMSNDFWKFRELSAVFQLPGAVTNALRAQEGSNLVLAVRNIHTWSSFTGLDPEANYGLNQADNQLEFQTAAPPTYFTLRLNLKF